MLDNLRKYLRSSNQASTLAFFRLAFGLMMFLGLVRFAANGWIDDFYIKPQFHFTYYGFDWVKPRGDVTYLLFIVCGLAALGVAVGYKYRLAAITFFLSFTYIELMDKTTYLNHYYFVSVVGFLMIFLPANACFSVDAYKNNRLAFSRVPSWTVDSLKILLGIVYFYAGLAKINSDWLIKAMPLKIWLPKHVDVPLVGGLLNSPWLQYSFSWGGMIYDLLIVFLLLYKRTRIFAFIMVVFFHVVTRLLFPIGIFPFIMIVSTLIFFDSAFHEKVLKSLSNILKLNWNIWANERSRVQDFGGLQKLKLSVVALFLLVQLAFPFRYLFYPGELFWTEEGFRFSWRVMLMEKAGYAQFIVTDPENGKQIYIKNSDFLTQFQEKQMSFQPDFIVQYAHFLKEFYQQKGIASPEVHVQSFVALNGRLSQPFIDPNIDLAKQHDTFAPKTWILPFNDEIWGL